MLLNDSNDDDDDDVWMVMFDDNVCNVIECQLWL